MERAISHISHPRARGDLIDLRNPRVRGDNYMHLKRSFSAHSALIRSDH